MPTVKEWYCPSESSNNILKELGNHTSQGGQGDNIQTSQAIIQTIQPTRIIRNETNIPIQTSKELISVVGQHEIVSLAFIVKNQISSLQTIGITIRIDDTILKDTLLNMYMFMQDGKGLRAKYYEEVTNVNLGITNTLHNSGSIFYLYISEPLIIKSYFGITIHNTYTATFNATLETKTLLITRGL